ncbi:MAG TPA: exosortase/archaeosortase family protein [Candidatus Limnocylindria bacterium]|jgi:exosortase|nr:exosortase/archaeosortase family protein [Candidatus Limnocylindria bacterium]
MADSAMAPVPQTSVLGQMVQDTRRLWASLPYKWAFGIAFLIWTALFHWFGNPPLGWIHDKSLFVWAQWYFNLAKEKENDDQLCTYIPFLVLFLFVYQGQRLAAVPKKTWLPALVFLLVAVGMHWIGYSLQQTRISMLAYLLGVYALMSAYWGYQWAKAALFPYWLIGFWIPLSAVFDPLTFRLRLVSCTVATAISRGVFNIPLQRMGTRVMHPGVNGSGPFEFDVAAACSGIRSATVVLILTTIYSFLGLRSWWRRAIVIAVSPLIAVTGNILRLVFTFVISDALGSAAGKAVENKAGFVTFAFAFAVVSLLTRWLARGERNKSQPVSTEDAPVAAQHSWANSAVYTSLIATAVLSGVGAYGIGYLRTSVKLGKPAVEVIHAPILDEKGGVAATNSIRLPDHLPGYTAFEMPFQFRELLVLPPDTTYGRRRYESENGTFTALSSVVLMGNDRTSLHKPMDCLTSIGWNVRRTSRDTVPLKDGSSMVIGRMDMIWDVPGRPKEKSSGLYMYWFVAEGSRVPDYVRREWYMLKDVILTGEIKRWAYISFFADCRPGEEDALHDKMKSLIQLAQPEIEVGSLRNM